MSVALCLKNGWNFSTTFKPSDMPALWDEAQSLLALAPGQKQTVTLPRDEGTRIIRRVNDLDYHGMRLSAIFQEDKSGDGPVVRSFAHLLQQLVTRGRIGAVFREAFHTFLNFGKRMIESLRRHAIPEDLPMPGQIRLSTA